MKLNRIKLLALILSLGVILLGFSLRSEIFTGGVTLAQQSDKQTTEAQNGGKPKGTRSNGVKLMPDTPAAYDPDWERPYPQYQRVGKDLLPYPKLRPGDITPTDLYRYGGPGTTSFASIDDVEDFNEFYNRLSKQKPEVMARWKRYLNTRYDFTCEVDEKVTMTRGKPLPVGPVVLLPKGVKGWEELASLSAKEIYERDLFPEGFRPLAHPLHSTAHQLFPQMWTRLHSEHERFDVDFDLPEEYLPEFPPPLFLTTRPDLGDVSKGQEITQANFHDLFDGI